MCVDSQVSILPLLGKTHNFKLIRLFLFPAFLFFLQNACTVTAVGQYAVPLHRLQMTLPLHRFIEIDYQQLWHWFDLDQWFESIRSGFVEQFWRGLAQEHSVWSEWADATWRQENAKMSALAQWFPLIMTCNFIIHDCVFILLQFKVISSGQELRNNANEINKSNKQK